jgi:hypothetical protein
VQLRTKAGQISAKNNIWKLGQLVNKYYPEKTGYCNVCKQGIKETVNHFMFECIEYNNLRRNSIDKLIHGNNLANLIINGCECPANVRLIVNYVKDAILKRSAFVMD